jgi:hypothetical protein
MRKNCNIKKKGRRTTVGERLTSGILHNIHTMRAKPPCETAKNVVD